MNEINEWESQDSPTLARCLPRFPVFFSILWFRREMADGTGAQLTRSLESHGVNLVKQQPKDPSSLVQIQSPPQISDIQPLSSV